MVRAEWAPYYTVYRWFFAKEGGEIFQQHIYKYSLPALGIISVSPPPPIRPVSTRHTRQIDGGDDLEGMRTFIQKQGKTYRNQGF